MPTPYKIECPRCLGKGRVDRDEIKRLKKELIDCINRIIEQKKKIRANQTYKTKRFWAKSKQ